MSHESVVIGSSFNLRPDDILAGLLSELGIQTGAATSLFGQQAGMGTEEQLAQAIRTLQESQGGVSDIGDLLSQSDISQLLGRQQDVFKAQGAATTRGLGTAAARTGNVGAALQAQQQAGAQQASALANATRQTLTEAIAGNKQFALQKAGLGAEIAGGIAGLQATPTRDEDLFKQLQDLLAGSEGLLTTSTVAQAPTSLGFGVAPVGTYSTSSELEQLLQGL